MCSLVCGKLQQTGKLFHSLTISLVTGKSQQKFPTLEILQEILGLVGNVDKMPTKCHNIFCLLLISQKMCVNLGHLIFFVTESLVNTMLFASTSDNQIFLLFCKSHCCNICNTVWFCFYTIYSHRKNI